MADVEDTIARRLEELGVTTQPDEVQEIATAYPALVAWMRMAEELARDADEETAE